SWTATSTTNAPSARSAHTAVWTGNEMIVWGGSSCCPTYINTGGRYNPSTNSWTATSITNAPESREVHTAVWTGSEMIIWGGGDASGDVNSGGRYCVPSGIPTPTPAPTPCTGGCVVTNTNDNGPGSLRQAILDTSPGNTITFAPSVTT